ncbi:S-methyl-5-thioribose kinase [Geminicoccaceae bacterium 1502E]|nr:S-methyl-5-thioribose kinase [Geminicoccaceae bacterium 1502E]
MAIETPEGYRALSEHSVCGYVESVAPLRQRLGGNASAWRVREVGDGNLNLVFIIEGPAGDLCVKQALPYVRLVGEGWPLPLERAWFEHQALLEQSRHAPDLVPQVLHYDEKLFLLAMERLSPHIIMRRGMIDGLVYPRFAGQISHFLARTLYFTSDLALPAARKKAMIGRFCGNTELCRITEDLIFTDPYMVHERNRWTTPELDETARELRQDAALKLAVARLKLRFMSDAQALLHGDMHTGSIMVTEAETKVIDPEFAFVGPIGFDVGKLLGNLLLSYFSQRGHETRPGERDAYRAWILETVREVWDGFEREFLALWRAHPTGDAYPAMLFEEPADAAALGEERSRYMRALFQDALGFAGTSMIRRTLGLAHNADMEEIAEPARRAACERRNLRLARELIVHAADFADIARVTQRAAALEQES